MTQQLEAYRLLDRTWGVAHQTSHFRAHPRPTKRREPHIDGVPVSANQGGAANLPPPSFTLETGVLDIKAARAFGVYYFYDDDDKPEGWGGNDRGEGAEAVLQPIDYKTGKIRTGDTSQNLVALDDARHFRLLSATAR